jgi:hypothetical protein
MLDKSELLQTLTALELSNLIAFTIKPNTSAKTLDKLQLDIAAIRKEQKDFFKLLELEKFYREIVFANPYPATYSAHIHGVIETDFMIEELEHYSKDRPFKYYFKQVFELEPWLTYIENHEHSYPKDLLKSYNPSLIINRFKSKS